MANLLDELKQKKVNLLDELKTVNADKSRIDLEPQTQAAPNRPFGAVPGMQPILPDYDVLGTKRQTEQTRTLPEIQESGLLAGEDQLKAAGISPVLLTTTNPDEIAKIISSSFPNVGVAYNKDAKGGVYPILRNNETGAVAQVNKPGISGVDVMQLLGIGAAFTPAAKATTAIGAAVGGAATQAAIEGAQAVSGGDIDPLDVAVAGAGGAAAQKVTKGLQQFFTKPSKGKQKIAELIMQNSDDKQRSGFVIKQGIDDTLKVVKDPAAKQAAKQGIDDGVISMIESSSNADKASMRKAVEILKGGKKSKTFAVRNRPGDAAGEVLKSRYDAVKDINKKASKEIRRASNELLGKTANVKDAYNQFIDGLEDLGVSIVRDKNGKLKGSYANSEFAQSKGTQKVLNDFIARSERSSMDGMDAHRLKRVIDGSVEYGKKSAKDPLLSKAENLLKGLRAGINNTLKDLSENYKKANIKFADSKQALDEFANAAGPNFNPNSENASKQLVNVSRSLMSNNQKRVPAMDSINSLQEVAKKYGRTFEDDILKQAVFMEELETLFGSSAPTSFLGQLEKVGSAGTAASRLARGDIIGAATEATKIVTGKGTSEDKILKALDELLK